MDAIYAELGPGRGTLAADALRVMRGAGFRGSVHFVETSPALREVQERAMPGAHWHESIEALPAKPLLLVANEFLDALPVRQHVDGIERHVLVEAGGLAFDRDGEVVETSPARDEAVSAIATCLAAKGGAAIFIDYGHEFSSSGDTLQAVRRHRFAPVLVDPGEQDVTSHVDFQAIATAARNSGASVTPLVTQGEWLIRLGIEARAQRLSSANPDRSDDVQIALERLTGQDQMGQLFKVIAIHSRQWPAPAGFE
jgi:SAM-dependent MidA family methyltransferase